MVARNCAIISHAARGGAGRALGFGRGPVFLDQSRAGPLGRSPQPGGEGGWAPGGGGAGPRPGADPGAEARRLLAGSGARWRSRTTGPAHAPGHGLTLRGLWSNRRAPLSLLYCRAVLY